PPATGSRTGWSIGQWLYGGAAFRGVVSDARVYAGAPNEGQVQALYRCSAQRKDLGPYYYLPIYLPGAVMEEAPPEAPSTPFHNEGRDYSGIQLALPENGCALGDLRGAAIGQDLRISMDLLVPTGPGGTITEGGPYFRSRRA